MNTKHLIYTPVVALLLASLSGCLPSNLQKYRREAEAKERAKSGAAAGPSPIDADVDGGMPAVTVADKAAAASSGSSSSSNNEAERSQQRATIYAIDKQTFRFAVNESDVWDSALNVLLRNYNLTIVDKTSGIISTEWDSYYLNNAVYRNKLSMRVNRAARGLVEVTIHNNVERLKDASQAAGTVGAVWLPAEDLGNETARIVQNMALVLNQPPPVLPPNMRFARDTTADTSAVRR